MRESPHAFGWPSTIATIVVGAAVTIGFLIQVNRRTMTIEPLPSGVWESRQPERDGFVVTRRIAFGGLRTGEWYERRERGDSLVSSDSAAFALEGPRANRFCIQANGDASDCRIVIASRDSIVMMFGAPTVASPAGDTRWVFQPVP